MAKKPAPKKTVETLVHADDKRKNIPTAEFDSLVKPEAQAPVRVAYARRNRDLDPQLVWRGKDEQDAGDLLVPAPPIYIQEKVHPKVLIDDLLRQSTAPEGPNLFADFNGIPDGADKTDFYQHDQSWTSRMILGDSLQVMASLAEREGLRGKVQCIYFDPPYGIKFSSNFQWSTTSTKISDGNSDHIRSYAVEWLVGVWVGLDLAHLAQSCAFCCQNCLGSLNCVTPSYNTRTRTGERGVISPPRRLRGDSHRFSADAVGSPF